MHINRAGDAVRQAYRRSLLEHDLAWLCGAVLRDTLPWGEGKEYSFRGFAEKYTLHDSVWVGVFYDVAYADSAVLVIIWDAVWLPDELARSTSVVGEWPLLFIKVGGASQVSASGYKDVGGLQRGIAGAEIEEVDGTNLLVITDHYGGSVEITFSGALQFLALDRDRRVLPI